MAFQDSQEKIEMIFIPGNVPSSKNSRVATSKGVFHSRTVSKYLRSIGVKSYSMRYRSVDEYRQRANVFRLSVGSYFDKIRYPAILGFHFVRNTRRQFDFHNVCQVICDLLVAHRYLMDDSMDYLIPVPRMVDGRWYSIDKINPGVFLELLSCVNTAFKRPEMPLVARSMFEA
jgi:hypothetical protein